MAKVKTQIAIHQSTEVFPWGSISSLSMQTSKWTEYRSMSREIKFKLVHLVVVNKIGYKSAKILLGEILCLYQRKWRGSQKKTNKQKRIIIIWCKYDHKWRRNGWKDGQNHLRALLGLWLGPWSLLSDQRSLVSKNTLVSLSGLVVSSEHLVGGVTFDKDSSEISS